jgi:hypothetical protein
MSYLALSNSGEQKTASEFHDDYIISGVKCEKFMCPFCFTDLIAKAIYIDAPQGKSPHFSCFPGKPHRHGCDGYPLVNSKTTRDPKSRKTIKIGKEEFLFPEKLVLRSKASRNQPVGNLSNISTENTLEKVKERRDEAGKEGKSAKYTSSLIRSFASSHKEIISVVYEDARNENLSKEDRSKLLKEVLSKFPIELNRYETNYQLAFQGTKYFNKHPKIWNGRGVVEINGNTILILSNQATEYSDTDRKLELSFYISVENPDSLSKISAYHKSIIELLRKASESALNIRWYGYGLAKLLLNESLVLLEISNLDHLFVENI